MMDSISGSVVPPRASCSPSPPVIANVELFEKLLTATGVEQDVLLEQALGGVAAKSWNAGAANKTWDAHKLMFSPVPGKNKAKISADSWMDPAEPAPSKLHATPGRTGVFAAAHGTTIVEACSNRPSSQHSVGRTSSQRTSSSQRSSTREGTAGAAHRTASGPPVGGAERRTSMPSPLPERIIAGLSGQSEAEYRRVLKMVDHETLYGGGAASSSAAMFGSPDLLSLGSIYNCDGGSATTLTARTRTTLELQLKEAVQRWEETARQLSEHRASTQKEREEILEEARQWRARCSAAEKALENYRRERESLNGQMAELLKENRGLGACRALLRESEEKRVAAEEEVGELLRGGRGGGRGAAPVPRRR